MRARCASITSIISEITSCAVGVPVSPVSLSFIVLAAPHATDPDIGFA